MLLNGVCTARTPNKTLDALYRLQRSGRRLAAGLAAALAAFCRLPSVC